MAYSGELQTEQASEDMNGARGWLKARIRTVLLATDSLQSSRLALDYAAAFAHHFQAQLITVNAFELGPEAHNVEVIDHKPSRTRTDAEARLQAFTSGVGKLGVSAKWALVEGTVPKAILRAVSENNAGFLVVGTQGVHGGLSHLLIGSNTEALMLASPCPTLTVGPHVRGETGLRLGFAKLVYISNLTMASAAAAPFVNAFSRDCSAPIEIYQGLSDAVRNDTARLQQMASDYCGALKALCPEIDREWHSPEFQLSRIRPGEAVLASSNDPSGLIMLGVQPASYLGRPLHTSFAYRLLATAACPILTVPSAGHQTS